MCCSSSASTIQIWLFIHHPDTNQRATAKFSNKFNFAFFILFVHSEHRICCSFGWGTGTCWIFCWVGVGAASASRCHMLQPLIAKRWRWFDWRRRQLVTGLIYVNPSWFDLTSGMSSMIGAHNRRSVTDASPYVEAPLHRSAPLHVTEHCGAFKQTFTTNRRCGDCLNEWRWWKECGTAHKREWIWSVGGL